MILNMVETSYKSIVGNRLRCSYIRYVLITDIHCTDIILLGLEQTQTCTQCSLHSVCDSEGNCSCDAGFSGEYCETSKLIVAIAYIAVATTH